MGNQWQIARKQLDSVSAVLSLPENVHQILRSFDRILTVSVPTQMDDGAVKGDIRHPNVADREGFSGRSAYRHRHRTVVRHGRGNIPGVVFSN